MNCTFIRVVEAMEKDAALRDGISDADARADNQRFSVDLGEFAAIPGSPFTYWVSRKLRQLFADLPPFQSAERLARQGLATADDFRFIRAWWAVPADALGSTWFPFVRGGASTFYADLASVVRWELDGHVMKAWASSLYNNSHWSRILKNTEFHFRAGLTFPRRPHRSAPFSAVPEGSILSVNGPMVFVPSAELLTWLAALNARAFHYLVQLLMARGQAGSGQTLTYEVGMVAAVPIPPMDSDDRAELGDLAAHAWRLRRSVDTINQASHAFVLPALSQIEGSSLAERADAWTARVRTVEAELDGIQAEIDRRCFDLYGIEDADRRAIRKGLASDIDHVDAGEAVAEVDEADDGHDVDAGTDAAALAAELVSWAAGVAFGRFDIRLATQIL